MSNIEWDEKFFMETDLYVWIFDKGSIESSNEELYKANLLRMYNQSKSRSLSNLVINKNEGYKNEN